MGMIDRGGKYLLEAEEIVKRFGEFTANDGVTLGLRPGEIHALLGENGAGKSTLVKIIYGALQPTAGRLRWRGETVTVPNPGAARQLGIGMVFQHFSLFDALTVVENIALALPGPFDPDALAQRVTRVSREYGLPLEPAALVADLPVGVRQRIEVVRCLLQEPRLLIMDEPTAVLTPQEARQLFTTLRRLADEGCAVLYISHRLEEVRQLCHHATILRHGRVVADLDPRAETATSLARLMVGADVQSVNSEPRETSGPAALTVTGVSLPAVGPFGVTLRNVSLEVRSGEVTAVAGVAGNGQSELFELLSGERSAPTPESVIIAGRPCGIQDITQRRRLGAAFVPEERLGHSAVPGFRLSENVLLTRHASGDDLVRSGFISGAVPAPWRLGSPDASTYAPAATTRKPTRSPAATSRSSWWDVSSTGNPGSWSSTSPPGAWTPAPPRSSARPWWTRPGKAPPYWSSARISTRSSRSPTVSRSSPAARCRIPIPRTASIGNVSAC